MEEGFNNKCINKEEYEAMKPEEKGPGKFYCNFKVHKPHEQNKAPPVRPIISGSGSLTENPSLFIEHHLKDIAKTHKTFIQDTPDFLRNIESINDSGPLPENALLVTVDITGLYTNIPQEEGAQETQEALDERETKTVPTEFIVRMLELIQSNNIFQFNSELFSQSIGDAMGQRHVPHTANIFLDRKIDRKIIKIASQLLNNGKNPLHFMKRFLDDIFKIFLGTTKELHRFLEQINKIHPNIKFTMSHTTPISELKSNNCECQPQQSVQFLDTSCTIKEGRIIVDLYRKPTDRNQYLLTSSCHPTSQTENIPFSLAMRIVRVCSEPETRDLRLQEMQEMLLDRSYGPGMVKAAISRARAIPRAVALRYVAKTKQTRRPIFVVTYDPRLPNIQNIQQKHWRRMRHTNPYLSEVFPETPLVAFKRQKNIREFTIRAQVPPTPNPRPKRKIKGMKKCGKSCPACPYIREGKTIKIGKSTWNINTAVNCESFNIIYVAVSSAVSKAYLLFILNKSQYS